MLNGLDLFSGIGGLSVALARWVRPIAYCENDHYAQGVLLSRMADGQIPFAPIWDDVRTLSAEVLPGVDIIYGGFPCQDISVAGLGKGLAGERSGLFFEILRLADEVSPTFIFLENVPAIRTRGGEAVGKELASRGYDCRWLTLSAAEVGAPHKRDRWWLLAAHPERLKLWDEQGRGSGTSGESSAQFVADASSCGREQESTDAGRNTEGSGAEGLSARSSVSGEMGHSNGEGQLQQEGLVSPERGWVADASWWAAEPNVGRVAHGVPARVDRLRALGNAVVPLQAREAFKALAGLK
jgi:DNA (cytosine-5)-methyltransferase 1